MRRSWLIASAAHGALVRRARPAPAARGFAALETAVALPALLLTGLAVLQFGLVLHARQAVMHSATEGARSGAVGHAAPEAIEQGLARGLSPWLHGAQGHADHRLGVARTRVHLSLGLGAGWVRWRQLSPTERSFEDWAVPSTDENGLPIAGTREIPTDNLGARALRTEPRSGRASAEAGSDETAPIGLSSGQTLADANLLKIEFTYGVPLTVPLAGRMAAWVMRQLDGCGSAASPSATPLPGAASQGWRCPFYNAREPNGRALARWPVRVAATARLQQPARHAGAVVDESRLLAGARLGAGIVSDRPLLLAATGRLNPLGVSAGADGSSMRDPGFLRLGGRAAWPVPGVCHAP